MNPILELHGRTALILDGPASVGRSVAERLGAAGARVFIHGSDDEFVQDLVSDLHADGIDANAVAFDPTCLASVSAIVSGIGSVDICIVDGCSRRAFGVEDGYEFVDSKPKDWAEDARAFTAVANTWRAVLPRMISNTWGRLVAVAPDVNATVHHGVAMAAANGAATAGLGRSVAAEVGRYGITVNCVSVGPMVEAGVDAEDRRSALPDFALPRLGRADDVAGLVAYLVSPTASWITGQTVSINGGIGGSGV